MMHFIRERKKENLRKNKTEVEMRAQMEAIMNNKEFNSFVRIVI